MRGNWREIFVRKFEQVRGVHVANHNHHAIVRRVTLLIVIGEILAGPSFYIRRPANDRPMIGVRNDRRGVHLFEQRSEIVVVYAKTPLRVNDAALRFDRLRVEAQMIHPIRFHLYHQFERVRRKPIGIDSVIFSRVGIVIAAILLHQAVEFAGPIIARAVEHHVFKKMGKAGDAGAFIAGTPR